MWRFCPARKLHRAASRISQVAVRGLPRRAPSGADTTWPRRGARSLSSRMRTAQRWFSHAARALEHCGCGQAQRSFRPLPSAASAQAWLQYSSPADTGQLHCGLAQRSSIAASAMRASKCQAVEVSISRTPFDAWRRPEEGLDSRDTGLAFRTWHLRFSTSFRLGISDTRLAPLEWWQPCSTDNAASTAPSFPGQEPPRAASRCLPAWFLR